MRSAQSHLAVEGPVVPEQELLVHRALCIYTTSSSVRVTSGHVTTPCATPTVRHTACYDQCMANTRFSISTDPAIQRAIKAHAEAAGMDVSAYMVAAAIAQMAADDAASAVFAPLDEENAAALAEAA